MIDTLMQILNSYTAHIQIDRRTYIHKHTGTETQTDRHRHTQTQTQTYTD